MPNSISDKDKETVRERAGGCCEYCLCPEAFSTYNFSIDHIFPLAKGGGNELINLAFACQGCNGGKYTKTTAIDPISQKEVFLYNPRIDKWNEHFSWSSDFMEMIGKTAKGRATISALKLNRRKLKNLRRALYAIKEHPPKHLGT